MGFLSRGFFFQAEDGIRDWSVTGVQTCALPIWQGVIAGIARYSIAGNTGGFIDDAHLGAGDRQSARVPDYASDRAAVSLREHQWCEDRAENSHGLPSKFILHVLTSGSANSGITSRLVEISTRSL